MKKIVIPIRLPDLRNLDVECPAGAVARSVVMAIEKVDGSIIVSAGNAGKQAVREVMNVVLECDVEDDENGQTKDPVIEKRGFLIAQSLKVIEEETLEYIGSAPSMQHGVLLHVFEFTPKKE